MAETELTSSLPAGDAPEAILEPYWPDRVHRFVWRNWSLVDLDRMAAVLQTDPHTVEQIGASMGLPAHRPISPEQWRRSYITIIRRNWHELPYEQLLQLLGWDEDHLAVTLKEDDFLWIKLGCLKPRCRPLRYRPPDASVSSRVAEIRQVVDGHFGSSLDPNRQEARFAFIESLSRPPACPTVDARIGGNWRIELPQDAGPVAAAAARRFAAFLGSAFGITVDSKGPAAGPTVHLSVDRARFEVPESHEVRVEREGIWIAAADEEGLLRGLQFLRQQMQDRRSPILPPGVIRRETQFRPRYLYAYFALFGDPLMEPELELYPPGYLERLSQLGIDGVWLQGLLWTMAPSSCFPEFGQGAETRLANLQRLVEQARSYGIGVWLYLNEPRGMPAEFFKNHPEVAGVHNPATGMTALCSSTDPVKRFLVESTEYVFRRVPDLAGAFTITASENLTHCHSHGYLRPVCPRCAGRDPGQVIAEVNRLIAEGVARGSDRARTIAWDWSWSEAVARSAIPHLPTRMALMSVSEWDTPITRGGIASAVGEYCLSVVGPGPRARKHWQLAQRRGLRTMAKVQFNNSWEFSAAPYMLSPETVARHCRNLARSGVDGLMLGWTLGGCPSPNLEVAREFYWTPDQTAQEALTAVARRRYGPAGVESGLAAWKSVREALAEFPFSIDVVYNAPIQVGPANPLYTEPTGYKATMSGIPYDDVEGWRGPYPPEVLAEQFAKVARGLEPAVKLLDRLVAACDGIHRDNARQDHNVTLAMQLHYAGVANQVRFVLARDALAEADRLEQAAETLDRLEQLVRAELDLAERLHGLAAADSRLGYEATNHYFYVPMDLGEKVINCCWILETWLPDQRRRRGL